jgi:hypothetical protein
VKGGTARKKKRKKEKTKMKNDLNINEVKFNQVEVPELDEATLLSVAGGRPKETRLTWCGPDFGCE